MLSFVQRFSKLPSLKPLSLKRNLIDFSLDRLVRGVDNIHIDVHISPQVQNAVKRVVSLLMIKHSETENYFKDYKRENLKNEINALRNLCNDVLLDGLNRAKSASEVQIDYLGQASLVKLFLQEIMNQYEIFLTNFKGLIRSYELSLDHDSYESFKIKEKLNDLKYNQKRTILHAGDELFRILADISSKNLRTLRESNFHSDHVLPDDIFLNPILYTDNMVDDLFLIEAYVLIGQRSEDPDNYPNVKTMIYHLLEQTDLHDGNADVVDPVDDDEPGVKSSERRLLEGRNTFDGLLTEVENIDLMFNFFDSEDKYERLKRNKEPRAVLDGIKSQMNIQESMLDHFYRRFDESPVMKRIVAAYEIKGIYGKYCPPLRLHQLREFLLDPSTREPIARQLKSRKEDSLDLLYKAISEIRGCSTKKRKQHLLQFLKDFSRYHRDLRNYQLLRGIMDAISLIKEDRKLMLSKENRSLYEFLLPSERVMGEKPIVNHVIMKADIRGSVDITYTMIERGLNPASYFSLNFFDPISEILFDYGGAKEFIEGDAIIMSIFEYEDTPQGWYSVARACGLAVRMLQIVQQYNVTSQKHKLPILELGIGICFHQSPPSFLFDGDSRIIISPAINLADRLSSCSKMLRKQLKDENRLFNLFVFQDIPDEEFRATADDLSLRYNVNGIELSQEGFAKLSREISLKSVAYPMNGKEKVTLYTGTVPTMSGGSQRLVIREAEVLRVNPKTIDVIEITSRKYYEVCAQPEIYEFIKDHIS
ncbi:MAG: hypothetical protein CVU61_13390 [Deltaproteobacteria bacterium HGW-Deltaproteobacteria-19]|nr:MAG: hypothetical protein CVU61_13390 [Deltaproteobacteria bacterium HGW-Deltaproteobacteria-19]